MVGKHQTSKTIIFTLLITAILLFTIFPLLWLLLSSFKTRVDLFAIPPKFFFDPTLGAYERLFVTTFKSGETSQTNFVLCMVNSFIEAGLGTILAVVLGTMAGYANSRFEYKGKKDFMFFVLSTRMLPPVAIIVPLYMLYARIGLADTRLGMILLYTMMGLGLSTWIMKGFFDGIPTAVEEAAFVNGYTRFQVFIKVLVPMVKGGIAATAGFCFIFAWNEFTFASIITTRYAITLPPRIAAALGPEGLDWGMVAAAGYILIVPVLILFILIRKYILMGMTFGVLGRGKK
ncbi:ABC transporter permease subunit [candidate division KSB3 bacterium]|uniref:ABC transporter permease subunit n=1 Tax=candidate division KSB3 bacterium TaxID=2044937 RepID=A0A9D5JXM3_9BACT|nr:ABC transporter permease subunit [candidate division KSB3 bacterium]MBD3325985.1 ABC transporter permease subunit [candidate division KSB3 bacterium]